MIVRPIVWFRRWLERRRAVRRMADALRRFDEAHR